MESSSILRNQSNNKIQSALPTMKNENNKMAPDPKTFRLQFQSSTQDGENQDPGNSKMVRKAPQRPGVSRLPVLAKSLRLQTPSNFCESHSRWEDKSLAGKAKKKKPCTRPVPFNLSQSKSSRVANENQPSNVSQLRTGAHAVHHMCNSNLKKQNLNANPSKSPLGVGSAAASTLKSQGNLTDNRVHPLGQSGPCNTFQPSTTLSSSLLSVPNNAVHHDGASSSLGGESSTNIKPVRVNGPVKTLHGSQNPPTEKGEHFLLDHAALLSILCNEGVSTTGTASRTPQSKPYNYVPQRVSVMKSQQKAGRVAASVKSVQFTPDAAALQSILQNEGVKDASSRTSVCPSGRGTSVYMAQRVPVKKKTVPAAVAVAAKGTPLYKWTPQRVPDTRHRPMSAMKWYPSPTPLGLRSCKADESQRQENVVQRLFHDREDEQTANVTEKDPETQTEQLQAHNSAITRHCEDNVETSRAQTSDEEDEQERAGVGGQPFVQAQERNSVIFFSTGKKLFRVRHLETQESSSHQLQLGPDSAEQRTSKLPKDILSVGGPTCPLKPAVHNLLRDLILQKRPAVALLHKRLPCLEELRMDDEVASYTSIPAPGFLPPRPRCGNPLAAILHFEESTKFAPIILSPSSPSSLTPQEL